jgi:hypothetical protein
MRTVPEVLNRLRAEYLEMPGLRLTPDQVRRLCGIERIMCQQVLDVLVDTKFLWVTQDGHYTRLTDGYHSRQPVKAHLGTGRRGARVA